MIFFDVAPFLRVRISKTQDMRMRTTGAYQHKRLSPNPNDRQQIGHDSTSSLLFDSAMPSKLKGGSPLAYRLRVHPPF